jgi:hypothetical protein
LFHASSHAPLGCSWLDPLPAIVPPCAHNPQRSLAIVLCVHAIDARARACALLFPCESIG